MVPHAHLYLLYYDNWDAADGVFSFSSFEEADLVRTQWLGGGGPAGPYTNLRVVEYNRGSAQDIVIRGVPVLYTGYDAEQGVESFITPDWDSVIDFYPTWLAAAEVGGNAVPIGPWVGEICEFLAVNARGGSRTREEWFARIGEHFGSSWLQTKFEQVLSS